MNEYPKVSEGVLGEEDIPKTNTEMFLSMVQQYFPEAIKDGEVDFAALKEEMGEFAEVKTEHYDFTWAGKQAAKKEAQADIFGRTLKYKPQDSLNPDTTENIYIEGDNLEALKLLRRNYHGKIKMIYIDPPYNTRNGDFIYRDDFSLTEEELAILSKYIDGDMRLQKNKGDDSRFHTKWLNMIYIRLKIARELLCDDGVIFISIDDNEQSSLKMLCDSIFGEKNFVGCISRATGTTTGQDANKLGSSLDYCLVYSKSILFSPNGVDLSEDDLKRFNETDEKGRYSTLQLRKTGNADTREERPNMFYPITAPDGTEVYPFGPTNYLSRWRVGKDTYEELLNNNMIVWKKTNLVEDIVVDGFKKSDWVPYVKYYLEGRTKQISNLFSDVEGNKKASISLKDLFKVKGIFDNPKPVGFISTLIQIGSDEDSIILDFFSGSATTAQSVLQMNARTNSHRRFILVQIPEKTYQMNTNGEKAPLNNGASKVALDNGYENICEIGKERIRRAAKKIHEENPDAVFDDGFKVFEVANTNIRWNNTNDEEVRSLEDIDYSKGMKDDIDFTKGANDIDIVYEIMLRQYGIPLSTPIEKLSDISDRTYIFADAVVVCLEPEINEELIQRLADIEPTPAKYILRDSAFNDDIELKDLSFRRLNALIQKHQSEEERRSKYNTYTVEFI